MHCLEHDSKMDINYINYRIKKNQSHRLTRCKYSLNSIQIPLRSGAQKSFTSCSHLFTTHSSSEFFQELYLLSYLKEGSCRCFLPRRVLAWYLHLSATTHRPLGGTGPQTPQEEAAHPGCRHNTAAGGQFSTESFRYG